LVDATTPFPQWAPTRPPSTQAVMQGAPAAPQAGYPAASPAAYPAALPAAYPPAVFNLDLQRCVTMNLPLFRTAWEPVWQLLAQSVSGHSQGKGELDPSMVVMSMFNLQLALQQCGISPQQEAFLIDALGSGHLHAKVIVPQMRVKGDEISAAAARAIQDWEHQQWYDFGTELGGLLREIVLITFPQKYSVDESGKLRRQILGASELPGRLLPAFKRSGFLVIIACFIGAMMVAMAFVRIRRAVPQEFDRGPFLSDVEAGLE